MVDEEPDEASPEAVMQVARAFDNAAVTLAVTPILCTRFQIFPMPWGNVLVLGGAAAATNSDGKTKPYVRPVAAFVFDKEIAENLAVALVERFEISDQQLINARKRVGVQEN